MTTAIFYYTILSNFLTSYKDPSYKVPRLRMSFTVDKVNNTDVCLMSF